MGTFFGILFALIIWFGTGVLGNYIACYYKKKSISFRELIELSAGGPLVLVISFRYAMPSWKKSVKDKTEFLDQDAFDFKEKE